MNKLYLALGAAGAIVLSTPALANDPTVVNRAITEQEVFDAQQAWCQALVAISTLHAKEGQPAAKGLAEEVLDAAYGYQLGAVLFKPTLTVNPQTFRMTRQGALAYFVGGDSDFPQDDGFALKDWTKCEVLTEGVLLMGNAATSMGKVTVTDKNGNAATVDKTWGWVKDDAGQMRIVLHHSSLEFGG
jgi:hypothetical protein